MLRQNGRLLLRVDALERALAQHGIPVEAVDGAAGAAGLPIGEPAPDFTLSGLHGETTTLEALLAPERPAVLVFTDPGCGPCSALLPQVTAWQRDLDGELTVALIGRGSLDDNRAKAKEHGVDRVFVEEGTEVSEAYDAVATPSAVLVRADGTIGSPVSSGRAGDPRARSTRRRRPTRSRSSRAARPPPRGRRSATRRRTSSFPASMARPSPRGPARRAPPAPVLGPGVRLLQPDAPRPPGMGARGGRRRAPAAAHLERDRGGQPRARSRRDGRARPAGGHCACLRRGWAPRRRSSWTPTARSRRSSGSVRRRAWRSRSPSLRLPKPRGALRRPARRPRPARRGRARTAAA